MEVLFMTSHKLMSHGLSKIAKVRQRSTDLALSAFLFLEQKLRFSHLLPISDRLTSCAVHMCELNEAYEKTTIKLESFGNWKLKYKRRVSRMKSDHFLKLCELISESRLAIIM